MIGVNLSITNPKNVHAKEIVSGILAYVLVSIIRILRLMYI